jgi:hypothetical protein
MRHLLTVLVALTLGAACTKREDTVVRPKVAEPETSGRSGLVPPSPPEGPRPPAILKLANEYLQSLPSEKKPFGEEWARHDFIQSFFAGFTKPTASMINGDPASQQGFKLGQEFRRAHPDRLPETFESFGYVAMEADGVYTWGMEHSGFQPRDHPGEMWWIAAIIGTASDLPKGQEIPEEGLALRITGFRSPKGEYGHLGTYDHEFYATKIKVHGR